jgi:hypothetical protein
VISYQSRSLIPSEQKYPPIELEVAAIAWAVQKFRQVIYGQKVLSDHQPLCYLLKGQATTPRMSKWQAALQASDITIEYRSGKSNAACDALSRYPVSPPEGNGDIFEVGIECGHSEEIRALVVDHQLNPDLVNLQASYPNLRMMIRYLKDDELPDDINCIPN